MSRAILLSGGMDSVALTFWQKPQIAFTIDYGQRPAKSEIKAATKVASLLSIQHEVIRVDCSHLGSGDLSENKGIENSPSTEWWPFRNQLLITLACMRGISLGIEELMIACVSTDSFHTDGTQEFYNKINNLVSFQEGSINITSPSISLTTVELIKTSKIPLDILLWAHSCHTSNIPCGRCRGCTKQLSTRQEINLDR